MPSPFVVETGAMPHDHKGDTLLPGPFFDALKGPNGLK
jgi:hypothetical protein